MLMGGWTELMGVALAKGHWCCILHMPLLFHECHGTFPAKTLFPGPEFHVGSRGVLMRGGGGAAHLNFKMRSKLLKVMRVKRTRIFICALETLALGARHAYLSRFPTVSVRKGRATNPASCKSIIAALDLLGCPPLMSITSYLSGQSTLKQRTVEGEGGGVLPAINKDLSPRVHLGAGLCIVYLVACILKSDKTCGVILV